MEDAVKRQRKTIGNVAGKIKETAQARDEFKKIKNIQWEINREDLIYEKQVIKKVKNTIFKSEKQKRPFGKIIYSSAITLNDTFKEQRNVKKWHWQFQCICKTKKGK